jgi:hypothetical protein
MMGQSRLADAEEASRRAVGILARTFGPGCPDALSLKNAVNSSLVCPGPKDALDLFERPYMIWRRVSANGTHRQQPP